MTEVGYDEDEIDTMWDEIKAKTKDEETDMQGPRKDPKRYPCDLKDDYVDRQNIRGARRSNVEKTKEKKGICQAQDIQDTLSSGMVSFSDDLFKMGGRRGDTLNPHINRGNEKIISVDEEQNAASQDAEKNAAGKGAKKGAKKKRGEVNVIADDDDEPKKKES